MGLWSPPAPSKASQSRVLRAMLAGSRVSPKDGGSITSLQPLLVLDHLWLKKNNSNYFFKWKLLYLNLCPLPLCASTGYH